MLLSYNKKEMLGLLYVALIIYFYVFLMKIIGFIFITPAVLIILMKLTGSVKWKEMIIVSISATVLILFSFLIFYSKCSFRTELYCRQDFIKWKI